jgi:hypothetical protein
LNTGYSSSKRYALGCDLHAEGSRIWGKEKEDRKSRKKDTRREDRKKRQKTKTVRRDRQKKK